jgi:ATP-dependent DNA helicase RecG
LEPPAPVALHRIPLPDSDLEVLTLEAADRADLKPFVYDGRPYVRLGTNTARMEQTRYQELLLARNHSRTRWESQKADGIPLDVLDVDEILRTVRRGIVTGRLPESTDESPLAVLERFQLLSGDVPLNAAIALFGRFDGGRGLAAEYPQCLLQLARFKGRTKGEFLDQRQIHGHCLALLDEAMLFLRRHLPVAGRIQPGLFERVDEPLFPLVALREALVNAICHRDYALVGGSVQVAVYDDRLEIWSDGSLPHGVEIADLKRDHRSRPRNPLLADVLFRRGLVERWGRGTQKIVELCVEAGHPEPEFVEAGGAVGVRFLPSGYVAPLRISHDLTERQREILQAIAEEGELPLREIHERITGTIATRTLQDDLAHLRKLRLIESVGRGRGAYYRLTGRNL